MERIYLDYAATTPVTPSVLEAMTPYFSEKFGNPGSLHSFGQEAIAAVDRSREAIAKSIGADFREIIFTGSATEANNLALRGVVKSQKSNVKSPRIIISTIEHESVLETARDLERDGVEVIYLPVDHNGVVDLEQLKSALNDRTVLVSVMYANNEIGSVQPIAAIGETIREFRTYHTRALPLFHTDAAQAFQYFDCDVNKLGVDLMTLSAHKIYGPKGVGALYVRKNPESRIQNLESGKRLPDSRYQILDALITGGGQEFGLRSGTENVPSIVGFAKATELAIEAREHEAKRVGDLKRTFWNGLKKICPDAETNGSREHDAPHILNVYFPERLAEELLTRFDIAGLAVSSGSACRSRAAESSYVIEALGFTKERARRNIRFSFGRLTTEKELDRALAIIKINST